MKKLLLALLLFPSLSWASFWFQCTHTPLGQPDVYRMRVPHGWLVHISGNDNVAYVPDEKIEWMCDGYE